MNLKYNQTVLSIIIPVYNEKKTIEEIIEKILLVKNIKKEIIIIDDCSNDGTREILKEKISKKVDKIFYHDQNLGKGAAIKSAQRIVSGDIVIIQDADLEYSPNDYFELINPIISEKTMVVYGSRVLGKKRYNNKNFTSNFRIFGNHFLTILSNFINNQKLTDAHTCYKVFKSEIFQKIKLEENDFSFCPEVTTKLSNKNIGIIEVPISYNGRGLKDGKKIRFYDAIKALIVLLKYKYLRKL